MKFRLFSGASSKRMHDLLVKHHSILQEDRFGNLVPALTPRAQHAALMLGIYNENLDAFTLASISRTSGIPFYLHMTITPLAESIVMTGLLSWITIATQTYRSIGQTALAFLAATIFSSLGELYIYFSARNKFLNSLERVGKLVDLNQDRNFQPLTAQAANELRADGVTLD
ncbi:hypothetical protein HY988_07605 [Candidatus Micrarchaeota archaeon]|nr:hypothetical protein [Candidatus Micrarchaeota archaeon]